jgi:hypothetical protein
MVGTELQGLLVSGGGLRQVALLVKGHAQPVVDLGLLRLQTHQLPVALHGLRQIAERLVRRGKILEHRGIGRVGLEDLAVQLHRLQEGARLLVLLRHNEGFVYAHVRASCCELRWAS